MPSFDLRTMYQRERQLQRSLEGVSRFIDAFVADRDGLQLSLRIEGLNSIFKEFRETRQSIEVILDEAKEAAAVTVSDGSESSATKAGVSAVKKHTSASSDAVASEVENDTFEVFEMRYYELKARLIALQAKHETVEPHRASRDKSELERKVKLPEIRLPSYSGNIREWVTFRDSFKSLIHGSAHLAEIDKFTYLRSALTGDALRQLDSIELTGANYSVAWATLENRYENKKLIVKAHLDALFAIQPLRKESFSGLNQLIGDFDKNIQMLGKIGENTDAWSTILAHMVTSRLDATTLRNWEVHYGSKDVPTYSKVMEFLKQHCSVLQSVLPSKADNERTAKSAVFHTLTKAPGRCIFCNGSWHTAFQCGTFQRLKVNERNDLVVKHKLCRNCLQKGHLAIRCDKGLCRHCNQKHHSMLHPVATQSSVPNAWPKPRPENSQPGQPPISANAATQEAYSPNSTKLQQSNAYATTSSTVSLPATHAQPILLATAIVLVEDKHGNTAQARALLDSGSQNCLMSEQFSKVLQFEKSSAFLTVQGIGSSKSVASQSVRALVSARSKEVSEFSIEMHFYVLPKLTVSLPTSYVNTSSWVVPEHICLADPTFHKPGSIDLIIGAEYYFDLLGKQRYKINDIGPTLQDTHLGWIVSGRLSNVAAGETSSTFHVCSTQELQDQLTRFWELETCRSSSTFSPEESACEEHFLRTTVRDKCGRYIVTLPKKIVILDQLGDSKEIAARRFASVERRLQANCELKKQYVDFMDEYLSMGHMKEVSEAEECRGYYIPHHAVLKPDSTTTKLRVVFDASSKTSTGVSLNDALIVGPVVQDDLVDIILRFRTHRLALTADIAKMYRMVDVQPADQHLQRILWRKSPEEQMKTYQLTTVTYGTASAPYLATRCLKALAADGTEKYPIGSKILSRDFYVDDMLSGVDRIEDGQKLVQELLALLQSAKFQLRKWSSNSKELLSFVPEHLQDDRILLPLDSENATVKTLGLIWEPSSDCFLFTAPTLSSIATVTKRTVLSDISRLFDPLGLVGPVVIQAKIFIQTLWKLDIG